MAGGLPLIAGKSGQRWSRKDYAGREVRGLTTERFMLASDMALSAWEQTSEMLASLKDLSVSLQGELDYSFEPLAAPDHNPPLFEGSYHFGHDGESYGPPRDVSELNDPLLSGISFKGFRNAPGVSSPNIPPFPRLIAPMDPNLPAPDVQPVSTPQPPGIQYPESPELHQIALPDPPSISLPPWEGPDMPSSQGLDMPERQFEYDDVAEYTSELLTQLGSRLTDVVVNGGTGLAPEIEQAIYDRAFLRQQLELDRRTQQTFDQIAGRGFNLPTGVLAGQLTELNNEFSRQLQEVNMEILIKQAELAQTNTHFAQDLAHKLETVLIQDYQVTAARRFEIAKAEYEFFLTYYRSRAEIYNLRVEGYRAYAQAFEARLRAALTEIEVYKAQLEGAKINMEIQKLGVDIYSALMNALSVRVELYKAEMQASAIKLEIEKSKVEIYQAQYEAYKTRVQAYGAQVEAYKTRVEAVGEANRSDAVKVQNYATEVEATKSENESYIARKTLELEKQKVRISQFAAELEKFKAVYQEKISMVEVELRKAGFDVDVHKVNSESMDRRYASDIQAFDARIRKRSTQAALQMEESKVAIENQKTELAMEMEKLKSATGVLSQVTASALGAVNASASLGFSESNSSNFREAFSQSYSDSRSDGRNVSLSISGEL